MGLKQPILWDHLVRHTAHPCMSQARGFDIIVLGDIKPPTHVYCTNLRVTAKT